MTWFKSKEEKDREKQAYLEAIAAHNEAARKASILRAEEASYDEFLAKVITPESQDQYEKRVGYAVELIDTGGQNKGIILNKKYRGEYYYLLGAPELKKHMVEAGIEAIVETNYSSYNNSFYGLPVARKKGGPYR